MQELGGCLSRTAGFRLECAEDGIKGQGPAMQGEPDLILLDLMLPVDGLTLPTGTPEDAAPGSRS